MGQAALAALTLFVVWLALAREGLSLAALGLVPLRWQALAWGALLAVFFVRGFGPAAYAALRAFGARDFTGGLDKLRGLPPWLLVVAVLVGGTSEEVLYRGYAIARLESLTGSLWLAALVPLVVFALAHVPLWGVAPALTTFFAGGVFTLFYLWQRDLAPNMIAHVATDFVGIVLALRARPPQNAN